MEFDKSSFQRLDEHVISEVTLILPTLNEEKSLTELFPILEEIVPGIKVIIADDGSKDDTKGVCENFQGNLDIFFLDRKDEPIHGLTVSVLHGINLTTTPYFIVMDADLQHPPTKIPEFIIKLQESNDLVVGKRVQVVNEWPLHRKLISWGATFLGKLALILRNRNRCADIMSGFFAGKTELFKEVIEKHYNEFALKGYKVLFDFLKITRQKLKIAEVEYVFGSRHFGSSKIGFKTIWIFFKSLF
ncbi:MAG: glycosyltransferase [Candidatus Heimdallarchaeaceae archaeon]